MLVFLLRVRRGWGWYISIILKSRNEPMYQCTTVPPCKTKLCPKLFFACGGHFALAFGTGLAIPKADVIAATLQA